MPAKPRLVSPAPAFPRPSSTDAESSRAAYEPATASAPATAPEPYWPRLGRAVLLLSLAVALHLWVVHPAQPQEPVYSVLASRIISSILIAPPLPLAPPLPRISMQRPSRRVTLQTTIMNVPALPGPPLPVRSASFEHRLVPVGTMGTTGRPAVIDAHPQIASFVPVGTLARLISAAEPASDVGPSPSTTIAAHAPTGLRSESAPAADDRSAPAAERLVAATSGGVAAPISAFDEQRQQKDVVLAVVHQYARALERLDVSATKAIYPTIDGRELRRAFEGLRGQQYYIASCDLSFSSPAAARARCTGNATFRPKVGSRVLRLTDYEWVINLARGGGGWQIREAQILEARNQ